MKQILKARFLTPLAQSPIGALLAACMLGYLTTFLAAGAAAQGANADLAGTWKGELGEGAAKLHLVLTITKASNGEFSGELNSVDQGAKLPMDSITLKADVFRFEVKAVSGVYEGKLNSTSAAEICTLDCGFKCQRKVGPERARGAHGEAAFCVSGCRGADRADSVQS